ncbi:MAG: FeoC-like transcriptional regulator [Dehalococcoidales bacterium]|nr:FeoC-like transcriptional regulator [Dehalococcoidales bacterium]
MLAEIMKAFREADMPMDLNELSRSLGTDRSALEGMLETLVRQGRLKEVSIGSEECGHCSGKTSCAHLQSGLTGKVFELTEKSA